MTKTRKYKTGKVLVGSCLDRLKELPDGSIAAIVTDPPYELGFMGKSWDASGIAYSVELWAECLRVLTPGGHLLAFGATRTYHRMTVAIEDAGFEVRDSVHWVYGSGFPKSLDVSKAIDKKAGAQRPIVEKRKFGGRDGKSVTSGASNGGTQGGYNLKDDRTITAPATDDAKKWEGWGTALKPAHEPIVLARKPLNETVAATVLANGTGALNIDGCRVGTDIGGTARPVPGRWPANIIFDEAAGVELDAQSGIEASRFFYCPKPSRAERDSGLARLADKKRPVHIQQLEKKREAEGKERVGDQTAKNHHPTVKPVELIRWLVRLITPPGGTVLDPFLGSGTTAVAAILEGFEWVGCEMTEEYLPIIAGRVKHAQKQR